MPNPQGPRISKSDLNRRAQSGAGDQPYSPADKRAAEPRQQRKPSQPPPRGRKPAEKHTASTTPRAPSAQPIPTGDTARDAAAVYLAAQVTRFPRLDLAGPDVPFSADPRDGALAHAIADAAVRRWTTLERITAKKAKKPLSSIDPIVRAAILTGLAQIVLLDRIPAYAAVNHAVQWTKLNAGAGSAGFVNAVLHRAAELTSAEPIPLPADWHTRRDLVPLPGNSARPLAEPLMPDDPRRLPAIMVGIPPALLATLTQAFGPQAALDSALASMANAPTILNTAHCKLLLSGPDLAPHDTPGHTLFTGPHSELSRLLHRRPDIWAQDPASSHTVRHAAAMLRTHGRTPARILDLCAGQGTKTRQLAATFEHATITATDTDPRRLATLSATFHGSPQVSVVRPDQLEALAAQQPFDLILLDVPCSNTGVLARRPQARHRYSDQSIAELTRIQLAILTRAATLLAAGPAATIIYATCSLDPRENQQQVHAAATLGLRPLDEAVTTLPAAPGTPPHAHHDGAFVALLSR